MWAIHTADERFFTGEYLVFENTSHGNIGKEIVKIYHYDLFTFFSEGIGVIDRTTSVVDGVLKEDETGAEYVILARNFPQNNNSCHNVVTAVTFCPLSVKDCKEERTYVLQRP